MIQLNKNYSLPPQARGEKQNVPIKVVGVGGAGCNVLDRIVLDGVERADVVALNTDVQSLTSSVAAHKVQLGQSVTRGLGAGGDPELGYQAGVESADEIRQALAGAQMIFLCAGLGGGTGSGAAPFVAHLAREAGSLVMAFVTLPFSFEGKRRGAQARDGVARLNEIADAVICFENDRMGDMVAPKAGIHHAFAVADTTISQSVRSIVNLIERPGLIRISFSDLLAALRSEDPESVRGCLFGFGESDSANRAHDALGQALKNPLLDRGRKLSAAVHVLVQIAGGPSMTLSEVEILMRELGRHVNDRTQILFGTAVDERMGNRLSVTIISSLGAEGLSVQQTVPLRSNIPAPRVREQPPEPPPKLHVVEEPVVAETDSAPADLVPFEQPVPPVSPVKTPPPAQVVKKPSTVERLQAPKKKPVPSTEEHHSRGTAAEKPALAKQEVLQFEPVTRGRFEKSEPTIVEGQDLDVPTFLRKNIRVK
jgi:cell division protein FtsZ